MNIEPAQIKTAVAARMGDAKKLLAELIATPSLSGDEVAAMEITEKAFAAIADTRRVAMSNAIKDDEDYSSPIEGIDYEGRWNLRASLGENTGGKRLLLNTHIDTVPPSDDQADPYSPVVRDGCMYGRGSCDAKGQAATIYLAMAALEDMGVKLPGEVIAHLVTEEEVGGNGTLTMARAGEQADGCVVLEPTEGKLLTSIRGAVWFRVSLTGMAAHPGRSASARSALDMAIRVVEILKDYHRQLLAESRGIELFDKYELPMPLVFGKCMAGSWPATVASKATLEGIIGLLPNRTAREVMAEMAGAIREHGGAEIAANFTLDSTYRHDCSVCPTDHPLAVAVQAAAAAAGRPAEIDAMTASCDACFYSGGLNIPTVVYGGGSLGVAHAKNEHMPLAELAGAAETLTGLIVRFCNGE